MSGGGLARARRIVVKVGSALVVGEDGPDRHWLGAFAADLARVRARGQQVLVVSSGAVALGRRRLALPRSRKLTLPEKQAAAAAGQSALMHAWEEALEPHGLAAAQILLTRDDTEVRRRWLNARATVETLLQLGLVPVVNENDTVVTEEIRYGDNDRLAARAAQMIGADVLVLLSDVDGLYTADPRSDPDAQHLPRIERLTPEIEAMAGGANAAAGVTGVEGGFGKGDAVVVLDEAGREIGRGIVRYDAADAGRICGLKSAAIEAALGYTEGPLIHADDLALAAHTAA